MVKILFLFRRTLFVIMTMLIGGNLYAQDFEVDGICFNKLSDNEVEVTANPKKYSGNINIPSEVVYLSTLYTVTAIGNGAFYGCGHNVKSITLPNTIKAIGDNAFKSLWDIKSFILPSSLITIGNNALNDCQSLESIDIPENVISIGKEAFDYCLSLKSVSLHNSLKTIGEYAFSRCSKLQNINIPNSVETIGKCAFSSCTSLPSIEIPNSATSLGEGLFRECTQLKHVTLSSSISHISSYLFYNCSALESVSIENTSLITSIGESVFLGCHNLVSLPFFTSIETIGNLAFDECYHLPTIYFPNTLQSIGHQAFYTCPSLSLVIAEMTDPFQLESQFFYVKPGLGIPTQSKTLQIPKGTKQKYEDRGWTGYFANIVEKVTEYNLSITSIGMGSVEYGTTSIKNSTKDFTIEEGTSLTISFLPDNGHRIKAVKINSTNVTSNVSNNSYTINNINQNIALEVEFEAIPPITYSLSITASGNGSASYNSTTIRNNTQSFTVNEGTNATITFTPDTGYRIKSVKLNSTDVTSSVSSNKYTISNITANTALTVAFEAIPPATYSLSITASGNGSVSYNSTSIRNDTQSFTVNEGTSATLTFTLDDGYRIASVKLNSTDVTSSVISNKYTISNITANTSLAVTFEAIPPTTYILGITSSGNGSASYNNTSIRNKTQSFTVNEGTSATITFTPDDGYRIKSVKLNSTDVTSSVSNNKYTISNITANTTLSVSFEAIPPTTYSLSITSSGNGIASYNNTAIRNKTQSFTVNEGTSATITFAPDDGYRIKSVKLNSTDVTSSVSNHKYTISNITANTTLSVTFEAIPPTTYTLGITSSGNGSASYNGTTIRNNTQSFTVNEGTSATITFAPDDGYRIKSVKFNSTDVTSSVSNNKYTISNITANTTLAVTFEAIPLVTYSLSITASGDGSVSYNNTTIRNNTQSFTVNEGTYATVTFTPDTGFRIKSVKANSLDVTSSISNNKYTINHITQNTTLTVSFEEIPPMTYTLKVSASGNGSVMYNNTDIRNQSRSFTVNEGNQASFIFTPDNGYRIASVKLNSTDVTSSVANNKYTISNITANTTLTVTFEAIPVTTYSLGITASGNGSVSFEGTTVRNTTKSFTLTEGSDATITLSPDNGNSVSSVKVNGSDVTSQLSGNRYTISNITGNNTMEVLFQEDVNALTIDGLNYTVTSQTEKTVTLTNGGSGQVLTVPATITQNGTTWKVTGIDNNALKDNAELAAIIWNPEAAFTTTVSNPNLLLYVKDAQYAPAAIKNVIVNGTANSIILTDAESGNNFYCPQQFIARSISYTHHYGMTTGIGESRGWETISLPFDVQTITHGSKGTIVPFAKWTSGSGERPFWLYELSGTGWSEAQTIKAYTPYIISMPNNSQYDSQFLLAGNVTFGATNVTVGKTENLHTATYRDRTFTPAFSMRDASEGLYALNCSNDFVTNNSGMTEGSRFVLNMRKVHPFEAYMTSTAQARQFFEVFDTGISNVESPTADVERYYDLQGRMLNKPMMKGVYIMNGKKIIIK